MQIIEWDDFTRVEMRVGTIVSAQVNSKAKSQLMLWKLI